MESHSTGPVPPAPLSTTHRIDGFHTRWRGTRVLEVWGRTSAPDGTTISITVSAGAEARPLGLAPAAGGRFYARERVPDLLRGQRLRVDAQIVP